MATAASQSWPGLAPDQQKLLLAALESNRKRRSDVNNTPSLSKPSSKQKNDDVVVSTPNGVNPAFLSSPSIDLLSNHNEAPPPYDFVATDPSLDVDFSKTIDGFDDDIPDHLNGHADGEQGEKRKMSDDSVDDDDAELGERDSKEAKKPGRKLLTSEPTTKRKAQNRAAQRAFRERKEKHLKDLETKVNDLEKSSESANHENSVLRAQIDRLQDELKDYKRRLSLQNNSPTSGRPSLDGNGSFGNPNLSFDFNFDFPKFGGVPGTVIPSTQAIQASSTQQTEPRSASTSNFDTGFTNGVASPQNSISSSTNSQSQGNNGSSMFGTGFFDIMGDKKTQSPQAMNSTLNGSFNATQDHASPSNTVSTCSRSPTSNNDNGRSSSCCTSPDPNNDWSSLFNNKNSNLTNGGSVEGNNFKSNNTPSLTNEKTPNSDNFSLDFLANRNGGQFDPVLFGDYREPQSNIIGDDVFSGGFFEDGIAFPDFNAPFNFNLSTETTKATPAPTNGAFTQMQQQAPMQTKKPNLMEQVAQQQEGNYTGAPTDSDLPVPQYEDYSAPNLMTCQKIWNQLQNCPRFQSGDFDVDTLCAELSAKAKCTNTGVAVPKEAVEAALWKLASNPFSEGENNSTQNRSQPQAQTSPAYTNGTNGMNKTTSRPDVKAEATRRFEKFMAQSH